MGPLGREWTILGMVESCDPNTEKCPQREVHPSQWSCSERFQGVREPHKNVFKVVYMSVDFFSEEETQFSSNSSKGL